jgi:hypothetical protein
LVEGLQRTQWTRTGLVSAVAIALAVWLGWQVIREPAIQRLPVAQAIRLAPDSPQVLSRAAVDRFDANELDDAQYLARDALRRSPFDVRSLRVLGLIEASRGRLDSADEILTLAGNWSLRDDPTQGWLVDRRLKEGQYESAFAHAETLIRRRDDLHPAVFELFRTAALSDPRALNALTQSVARAPPWRSEFLETLSNNDAGLNVSIAIAVGLKDQTTRFTNAELSEVYMALTKRARISDLRQVRQILLRPHTTGLSDGEFNGDQPIRPFAWSTVSRLGLVSEILSAGVGEENFLRVDSSGHSTEVATEQLLLLNPGRYEISGSVRQERGTQGALAWELTCLEGPQVLSFTPSSGNGSWVGFKHAFDIPNNCSAQWLRLRPRPSPFPVSTVTHYDKLSISLSSI